MVAGKVRYIRRGSWEQRITPTTYILKEQFFSPLAKHWIRLRLEERHLAHVVFCQAEEMFFRMPCGISVKRGKPKDLLGKLVRTPQMNELYPIKTHHVRD